MAAPEEARVRLLSRARDSRLPPGCAPGLGVVEEESEGGTLHGRRVIVPALIVADGDPPNALTHLVQAGTWHEDGPTMIMCPTRWLTPLTAQLELSPRDAAIAARPLLDAYGLVIAANLPEGSPVVVVGDGVEAAFARQLLARRGHPVTHLDAAADAGAMGSAPRLLLSGEAEIVDRTLDGTASVTAFAIPQLDAHRDAPWLELVVGGHPDLIAEVAALVVRGHIDVSMVPSSAAAGSTFVELVAEA